MSTRSIVFRSVIIGLFIACSALVEVSAQQESPMSPARPVPGAPQPAPPMMNMGLVAPLVVESSDWGSVVTLVNESKGQVHAQLSLRTADGEQAGGRIVALPGHSSRRFGMASLLNGASADVIGSLTIKVQEPDAARDMAVAAQLTLLGRGNNTGNSIDEELEMPKMGRDFKSVVDGSSSVVAVQNAGMESASAAVTCVVRGVVTHAAIQIPPNSFRLLQNCSAVNGDPTSASHVLAELSTPAGFTDGKVPGQPSAFEVNGGSTSELTVFGLSVSSEGRDHRFRAALFVNQSDFTSQSTVFAGIPIGAYSALPGATFAPTLTMANLSDAPRTATIRGTLNDSLAPPKKLSTVTLQPFEVRRLDVPLDSQSGSDLGTLIAEQDGTPGDVVFDLADADKLTGAVLNPLPKFLHHANNGGGHPWSLRPGTFSTLVVFNASAKSQVLNLNLGADGIIWKKTVTIQPYETLALPIQQIIDSLNNGEPSAGKKIRALTGEISWFTPDQSDVFGRVLIARAGNGGNALESYSCGSNIVLCGMTMYNSFASLNYLASGFLGPLSPQFCAAWAPTQCSGTQYGAGGASSYSWYSTNVGTTPISGPANQSNVGLMGRALGTGGAYGSGSTAYCQASAGGSAVVNPSILWTATGADITNGTTDVLIGQKVDLTLNAPATSIQSVQWKINPGTAVGYYDADSTSSSYRPVSTGLSELQYYNLSPDSSQVVTVTVTLTNNGGTLSAHTTLNVKAPTVNFFDGTWSVNVDQNNPSNLGKWTDYFGEANNPGITWDSIVTAPPGFNSAGDTEFVQIVNKVWIEKQTILGNWYHIQINSPCLDTKYPYEEVNLPSSNDSPGVFLTDPTTGGYRFWYDFGSFNVYLLWRPAYPNAIFVPVSTIAWQWVGAVSTSGNSWVFADKNSPSWYSWSINPGSTTYYGPLTWGCNTANLLVYQTGPLQ